jgi:hypothetical protein
MSKISKLRAIKTKPELANLIRVYASALTNILYRLGPETQYNCFAIPKKNGGERIICAPSKKLKYLQSKLSTFLQDCLDEIEQQAKINGKARPRLAHGFTRGNSILTNSELHSKKKCVLNFDLDSFFDSFNFGRVRGFFIKNKNFRVHEHIATVIAQIACHENKLPQGSPCSPVISNLITHSLDVRLARLAKKHSCTYSRYADDLTFSTRLLCFPIEIAEEEGAKASLGNNLMQEIDRAGFIVNPKKTRIQYKNSRQDVGMCQPQ